MSVIFINQNHNKTRITYTSICLCTLYVHLTMDKVLSVLRLDLNDTDSLRVQRINVNLSKQRGQIKLIKYLVLRKQ